jgi:hypothetical protein
MIAISQKMISTNVPVVASVSVITTMKASKKMRSPNECLSHFNTNTRKVTNRLVTVFAGADSDSFRSGMEWYSSANAIATEFGLHGGISTEHAAAVIAHLSPRIQWSRNIDAAAELIINGNRLPGIMSGPYGRALSSLSSDKPLETLKGQKISAFAANILGDYSRVTVDVWAMRAAFGDTNTEHEKWLGRVGSYNSVQHCYSLAANRVGITPAQFQAVTWTAIRGRAH